MYGTSVTYTIPIENVHTILEFFIQCQTDYVATYTCMLNLEEEMHAHYASISQSITSISDLMHLQHLLSEGVIMFCSNLRLSQGTSF